MKIENLLYELGKMKQKNKKNYTQKKSMRKLALDLEKEQKGRRWDQKGKRSGIERS